MKRPSFQFYPGDWLANSNLRRCTFEERGIWIAVLCLLHDQEPYGILRWPLAEIAQAVGCPVSKLKSIAAKDVLKGSDQKLTEPLVYVPRSGRKNGPAVTLIEAQNGPIWFSSRMVEDEHKRIIRGEHGIAPKDAPKPTFGDGMDDDIGDEPKPTPSRAGASRAAASSSSSPSGKPKPKPSSSSGDDGFEKFWEAYPRKQGKQDARKAWAKIKVGTELLATILAAIEAQKEGHDWKHDAGQFIPHPTTWLNGGRWLDEVRPYVPQERRGGDRWWETKEAMEAKGRSLIPPVLPLPGDTVGTYRRRIDAALEAADHGAQASPQPTPYVPPMPAGGESVLTVEQRKARMNELLTLTGSRKKNELEATE
jgi:hypothetical protein